MDPDAPLRIELVEEAGDWHRFDPAARIAAVSAALPRFVEEASGEVTLVLADDALVCDLNRRFRGKDRPTNVLSFPAGDAVPAGHLPINTHLGDVVLAAETLAREAEAENKTHGDHFSHLVVHGILHLMGYDHETDEQAAAMESLETAILADLGIADPYADAVLDAGDH
ncbi:rRNA maturation RNase YbeY [Microbaculum marinum]|uniref:Endoribonuclease YbeY n=1 Tax=Microbaculum marinum TaxID=1764581 RepID=A0AAW9RLA3_9HYPH